jgi:hypothetical protein
VAPSASSDVAFSRIVRYSNPLPSAERYANPVTHIQGQRMDNSKDEILTSMQTKVNTQVLNVSEFVVVHETFYNKTHETNVRTNVLQDKISSGKELHFKRFNPYGQTSRKYKFIIIQFPINLCVGYMFN